MSDDKNAKKRIKKSKKNDREKVKKREKKEKERENRKDEERVRGWRYQRRRSVDNTCK